MPDAPVTLTNLPQVTSDIQIGFSWSPAFDGASQIIDYQVSFDQASGAWVVLKSGITSTSYTATGLNPGSFYNFAVKARNTVGFGVLSNPVQILAAKVPNAPLSLVNNPEQTNAY